jgi:hypothetical protein
MPFFTARPHFEDRQIVQWMGESINLSGQTNFDLGGFNSYIYDSYRDFLNGVSGTTFLSLPFSAATDPVSGWSNQTIYQPGILKITPPHKVFFSGNTNVISATTREDVTNYIATSFDSKGTVVWTPLSGLTSMSGSCSPDLYVGTIHPCGSGGTVTIEGNLLVRGQTISATTIIETETLLVEDNNIDLNYGGSHTTAIGGGITVLSGISNTQDSTIMTDSNGVFVMSPSVSATTYYGDGSNLTGILHPVFTGNTSGDCITDLYVSNIHACSPLNINPNNEGDIYFGTVSANTFDLTNNRLGIGIVSSGSRTSAPQDTLELGEGEWMGFNTLSAAPSTAGIHFKEGVSQGFNGNGADIYYNASSTNDSLVISGKFGGADQGGITVNRSGRVTIGISPSNYEVALTHDLQIGDTTTPATIKIVDGNQGVGKVFTSDVDGVATWQTPSGGFWEYGNSDSNSLIDNNGIHTQSSPSDYSMIAGGQNNSGDTSTHSFMGGGSGNTLTDANYSGIIGGINNDISGFSERSIIIGGINNYLGNTQNSVILGGQNIQGTSSDTAYVPSLNIGTVNSTTPIFNLGIDSNGFVVTGTTGGGGGSFTGNTSGSCITDLWLTNLHGCSPITIHDSIQSNGSTSNGLLSFGFGLNTTASGDYSHAEGSGTVASGLTSHAEGTNTIAGGDYSHAEGNNTKAYGPYSHAQGWTTVASGNFSHAEGRGTLASSWDTHAEGNDTTASGSVSHAEGQSTTASGDYSHAEGTSTVASGQTSHAEGDGTVAGGDTSHAEGLNTIASGLRSHAEGQLTIASGVESHAGGISTKAVGTQSFVHGGVGNTAIGDRSVVLGGQGITGSTDDTVYVPNLNIDSIGPGTPLFNLGVDSGGNVVTGTTGGGGGGGGSFTGNTSGDCITDLYVSNVHGCSPITYHSPLISDSTNISTNNITNTTDSLIFGYDHRLTGTSGTISKTVILGGESHTLSTTNTISESSIIGGTNHTINSQSCTNTSIFGGTNHTIGVGSTIVSSSTIIGGDSGTITTGGFSISNVGLYNTLSSTIQGDNSVIIAGSGHTLSTPSSFMAGGQFNSIVGTTSERDLILGGKSNTISTSNSAQNTILSSLNSSITGNEVDSNMILGGGYHTINGVSDVVFLGGGYHTGATSNDSSIISGYYNSLIGTTNSVILGGTYNSIDGAVGSVSNTILGGTGNILSGNSQHSSIIGGSGNTVTAALRTVILGGSGIDGDQDDTVYVPNLNIGDNMYLPTPTVPSTSGDTGTTGQLSWDSGFVYVCVATNTWKRTTLSAW